MAGGIRASPEVITDTRKVTGVDCTKRGCCRTQKNFRCELCSGGGKRKHKDHSLTTMEELRALCGAACSAASVVASIVKTLSLPLDVNEFEFAAKLMTIVTNQSVDGRQVPEKYKDVVVRYVVEMCDWSNISGHEEDAITILSYTLYRVADTDKEPICDELQRALHTFTRDAVQRIQDGSSSYNLFCGFFIEDSIPVTRALARYGLAVIPDAVLFDVRVNNDNTLRNTIEMPITEMLWHSGNWHWKAGDDTHGLRLGVLEFLRVCIERMPERGFLSRKEKVAPGKHQYVLHSILCAITQATAKYKTDDERYSQSVAEVLQLLFQTPRISEDIRSIKNETSYYYFEPPGATKPRWVGLTLEDMVRRTHPDLLPIITSTIAKGAFDE